MVLSGMVSAMSEIKKSTRKKYPQHRCPSIYEWQLMPTLPAYDIKGSPNQLLPTAPSL